MLQPRYGRRTVVKTLVASCAAGVAAVLTCGVGLASAHSPRPTTPVSVVSPGPTSATPAAAVGRTPTARPSAPAPRASEPASPTPARRGTAPRPAAATPLAGIQATPSELASAIAGAGTAVTGASFVSTPSPDASLASSEPLAGFPRDGSSFAILSTGHAATAYTPNTAPNTATDFGGGSVRGDTDLDVTILKVDVDVPPVANCLLGVDFRFLSEEYPEWVGTRFNDAFIAEVDQSTWTTSGSEITAPGNFAFDLEGNPISINAAGAATMTPANAAGTTYDGGSILLSAAAPLTPGLHSLYFSIFDQGDTVYDSTVLLDNIRIGRVADPADCRPGARAVATLTTAASPDVVVGGQVSDTATLAGGAKPDRDDHLHPLRPRRRDLHRCAGLHLHGAGIRKRRLPVRPIHPDHSGHVPVDRRLQRRREQHPSHRSLQRPRNDCRSHLGRATPCHRCRCSVPDVVGGRTPHAGMPARHCHPWILPAASGVARCVLIRHPLTSRTR